jgi:hypothetical protein
MMTPMASASAFVLSRNALKSPTIRSPFRVGGVQVPVRQTRRPEAAPDPAVGR